MKTENLKIRAVRPEDADAISKIYAPYVENTAITFEYEAPSAQEIGRRISKTLPVYPYIVAEEDGKVIGYCYCSQYHPRAAYRWDVETSIYLDSACRGKGVGKLLYEKMEEILAEQGFCNVYSSITSTEVPDEHVTNASIHFHTKMGFKTVGIFKKNGLKFSKWYDVTWMEKTILERRGDMPEILPFEVVKSRFFLD